MPSPSPPLSPSVPARRTPSFVTKFTNCLLVRGSSLVAEDLWVSSLTGKIVRSQEVFYTQNVVPDETIDLHGRIISPGFIDVQMNGAFGFNLSTVPEDLSCYGKGLRILNTSLVETGVTSYLPTLCSSRPEVYHQILPFLGPSGAARLSSNGAESLGAHVEGPFMSPTKAGIHLPSVLQTPTSMSDILSCYGASNMSFIKLLTGAPELGNFNALIPILTAEPYNLVFSIGHSEADFEQASKAIGAGASMITHLFNAMRPLHHRNPGIFGTLGVPADSSSPRSSQRPYFGLIADGIHLHPTSISIAYHAYPEGMILVTDSMHLVGLPDGLYPWHNGRSIIKSGPKLILATEDTTPPRTPTPTASPASSSVSCTSASTSTSTRSGTQAASQAEEKIAGSAVLLIDCINNFLAWTDVGIPHALRAVTATPATMLGLQGIKGSLDEDADADLVVLSIGGEGEGEEKGKLVVDQVWKYGVRVYDR